MSWVPSIGPRNYRLAGPPRGARGSVLCMILITGRPTCVPGITGEGSRNYFSKLFSEIFSREFPGISPREFSPGFFFGIFLRDFSPGLFPGTLPRDFSPELFSETFPRDFFLRLFPGILSRNFSRNFSAKLFAKFFLDTFLRTFLRTFPRKNFPRSHSPGPSL